MGDQCEFDNFKERIYVFVIMSDPDPKIKLGHLIITNYATYFAVQAFE
jgi:hypothetical protein